MRRAGKRLAELGIRPDLVLTSPAQRALETAELAAKSAGWTCPTVLDDRLYHAMASPGVILSRQPEEAQVVVLSGHEPMCSELIARLCGQDEEPGFPPGSFAVLDFDAERWSEIEPASASLRMLEKPNGPSATDDGGATVAPFPSPS